MNTGIQWRAAVAAAGFGIAIFLTGCGGGDSEPPAPQIVSPASLATRSYNFSETSGAQSAVSFTSDTTYTFQHPTGAVENGTYQSARSGNQVNVTLASTAGGQQIYNLNFITASSGSYILHREGETDRSGSFSARSSTIASGNVDTDILAGSTGGASSNTTGTTGNTSGTTGTTTGGSTGTTTGNTTGGTTGTPTGSTTGNTSGTTTGGTSGTTTGDVVPPTPPVTPSAAYNGFAPVSIAGRTMFGTRVTTSTGTSGQTHTYTFSSNTFHDSDSPEESGGTYTYTAGSSSATLHLVYTGPADFVGDRHDLNMTFLTKDHGNFDSTYTRGDNTTITITGTFEFDPLP